MKRKKLLNEDVPQWVKDCCKKRKDRQCCNLVDDIYSIHNNSSKKTKTKTE